MRVLIALALVLIWPLSSGAASVSDPTFKCKVKNTDTENLYMTCLTLKKGHVMRTPRTWLGDAGKKLKAGDKVDIRFTEERAIEWMNMNRG